ncbi:MAG: hypothetical protein ACKERG_01765 [Candidatus Hodgkinia cicadicola]
MNYMCGMWVLAARRRATRCRLLLVFNRSPPALLPLSSRSPTIIRYGGCGGLEDQVGE